jgi:hypothetical protein
VYVVVKRWIRGQWVQYVERFKSRILPSFNASLTADNEVAWTVAEDSWFVDAGLDYPLTYPLAGLTINAASGTGVTVTTDANVFVPGDVGKVLRAGGGVMTVATYVSATQATVNITSPVAYTIPNDSTNTPLQVTSGNWSLTAPVSTVSGLAHLEGKTVKVLADGNVLADRTVTNGSITLEQPASRIIVGLGYQAQLQTLDLEAGEGTIQGKRKKLAQLTIKVQNTRGIKYGPKFTQLAEVKQRSPSVYLGVALPLLTGQFEVILDPAWTVEGRVCIQQDYPLPCTILAVAPDVEIGDNGR